MIKLWYLRSKSLSFMSLGFNLNPKRNILLSVGSMLFRWQWSSIVRYNSFWMSFCSLVRHFIKCSTVSSSWSHCGQLGGCAPSVVWWSLCAVGIHSWMNRRVKNCNVGDKRWIARPCTVQSIVSIISSVHLSLYFWSRKYRLIFMDPYACLIAFEIESVTAMLLT